MKVVLISLKFSRTSLLLSHSIEIGAYSLYEDRSKSSVTPFISQYLSLQNNSKWLYLKDNFSGYYL